MDDLTLLAKLGCVLLGLVLAAIADPIWSDD